MGNTPLNSAQGGPSNSGEESRLLETVTILLRKLETATLNLSSSATPGGSNTQVQFNDSGAFGGDAGLVYNKTTNTLTVGGIELFSMSGRDIIIGEEAFTTLNSSAGTIIGIGNNIGNSLLQVLTSTNRYIAIGQNICDLDLGEPGEGSMFNEMICIGYDLAPGGTNTICIGEALTGTAANQLLIGPITTAYLGNGVTNASPSSIVINATGGSGTDIAGANITIAAGKPTGLGAGGHVIIQTAAAGASGTTLRSLSTIAEFTDDAKIGFFGVTPVVRQTTTSQTPATFVANTSLTADDSATWNGYTIGDIVAVLQAYGFLT